MKYLIGILFTLSLSGQTKVNWNQIVGAPNTGSTITGTTLPATCVSSPADTFIRTTDNTQWYCVAGSWVQISGGSGKTYNSGLTGTILVDNVGNLLDTSPLVPRKDLSETIPSLWTFSLGTILTPLTIDPTTPPDGQIWVNNTSGYMNVQINGAKHIIDGPNTVSIGSTQTLIGPKGYVICTATCTVTVPVPVAGYEFCVLADDNVSATITLNALGSSAMYENTARTAYGTAGTGTLSATAAVGNKVCILGRDSTHYLTTSYVGTWTAN